MVLGLGRLISLVYNTRRCNVAEVEVVKLVYVRGSVV